MQQFSDVYVPRLAGIVHMGSWICAYSWYSSHKSGLYVLTYRPTRIPLSGKYAGQPLGAQLASQALVDASDNGNLPLDYKTRVLDLGGKVYRSHDAAPARYFSRVPDRFRVVADTVTRSVTSLRGKKKRKVLEWLAGDHPTNVVTSPSAVFMGRGGGLSFYPVGVKHVGGDWTPGRYEYQRLLSLPALPRVTDPSGIIRGMPDSLVGSFAIGYGEHEFREYFPNSAKPITRGLELNDDAIVWDFDYSPDRSRMVASVHLYDESSELRIYAIKPTGFEFLRSLDIPAGYVSFSPDGLTAATFGTDDTSAYALDDTLTVVDID